MLRIAICDDERSEVSTIQGYLEKLKSNFHGLFYEAYFSGDDLLEHYLRVGMEEYYDIIFMDVDMGEGKSNGISTATEIKKIDENPILVYITRFDKYVYDAYDTEPFNYLLKPVSLVRFTQVFKKAVNKLDRKNNTFTFLYNYAMTRLYTSEIICLESRVNKITVHTTRDNYIYNGKLKEAYNNLMQQDFVLAHGSYLLNMAHITKLKYDRAIMRNGATIPVSPARSKETKDAFTKFSFRRCDV